MVRPSGAAAVRPWAPTMVLAAHDGASLPASVAVLGDSAALLVAGADPDRPVRARGLIEAIGQLDQTLRSTRSRWAIRRLTSARDERMAPTRVGIKHALEAIDRQASDVIVVAIAGTVTGAAGEPALVTGPTYRTYPEEATLPLRWIGQRLAAIAGPELVVVLSARPDDAAPPAESWLAALAPPGARHAAFVEDLERAAAIEALSLGLRGAAVDPETGTVTLRSLADYLAQAAPRASARAERRADTIIRPASLDDLRALGWTRPAAAADAADAASSDDLLCAVLRGEIRVDEELARGSFGVVYRARQLWMRRDVAVKVLPPGVDARSEDGQLFLDEIRAVARIDHPNVVRVLQADETYDGRLFFAMELLTGEDLDQLADRGPVPAPRALALVAQLLSGLAAAHATGLIHADIKPGNVFVAHGGAGERVVLLDFGLARLARAGVAATSLGGTPQYMAPEQLTHGRIDERSDLFSAALVLFTLLTGWRRRRASEIVPPLDRIADEPLRAVLARALALDPAARYPRAADLAAALAALTAARDGGEPPAAAIAPPDAVQTTSSIRGGDPEPLQPPPFRRLRSFSERDRDRFFGRDHEVADLIDHVLQLPAIIYTAPSGVGKTSLLRAGLLPRLEALGGHGVYAACHAGASDPVAAILAALGGGASLAEAWAAPAPRPAGRRVLVIDQIETVLAGDETAADAILQALLGRAAPDGDRDQAVVLSVREDFLGRLVDRLRPHAPNIAILRLPPLTPAGARDALVRPLAARRLAIDDDLLEKLIADLTAAAASLGAEMGWGAAPAVYPPHLQLAGARLHETLPEDALALTLRQYQELGGIDEIVRAHLTHVLESELTPDQVPIARELFKHLITPAQTRAAPTEAELIAAVADPARAAEATAVLEALRRHGLVVRLARGHREARWELIHDSLIPRIQAWMDEHDLERRRALELLRHHTRQSRPEAPSLLSARELRLLRAIPDAVEVVEREWRERAALATDAGPQPWTPARLVAHSRAVNLRLLLIAGTVIAVLVIALAVVGGTWWADRRAQQRQQAQIATNLGRFQLELAPFDWDPAALTARGVPIAELPGLRWELREADPDDLDSPSDRPLAGMALRSSELSAGGLTRLETIEAPGRAAFLVVERRGRAGEACPPSILLVRTLPGYALRDQQRRFRVAVPTCQASAAGAIEIPSGPFQSGGPGDPPSTYAAKADKRFAGTKYLPRFSIDRTEVPNAAYELFNAMSPMTGLSPHNYPNTAYLRDARKPNYPASGMQWLEARAYCRYMGKTLPTSEQWEKSLRGGRILADGTLNQYPSRNYPWGAPRPDATAKLKGVPPDGPAPVGAFPQDVSPEGVVDLAGNVSEWLLVTSRTVNSTVRFIRGGNWDEASSATLHDFMAIENTRPLNATSYAIGFRCATSYPDKSLPAGR